MRRVTDREWKRKRREQRKGEREANRQRTAERQANREKLDRACRHLLGESLDDIKSKYRR